jgi:hypothetical protein
MRAASLFLWITTRQISLQTATVGEITGRAIIGIVIALPAIGWTPSAPAWDTLPLTDSKTKIPADGGSEREPLFKILPDTCN